MLPPAQPSQSHTNRTRNQETEAVAQHVSSMLHEEASRKRRRGEGRHGANKENDTATSNQARASSTDEKKATFQGYGRHVARLIDFQDILDHIVDAGITYDITEADDEEDGDLREMDLNMQHRVQDWKVLCGKIPNLQTTMIALASNRSLRRSMCRYITSGIEGVRSDDAAALKDKIASFISYTRDVVDPPISSTGNKADRGWRHPLTAALLCPITLEANQKTFDDIDDGKIVITANQFPRFLYPHNHQYAPGDDITKDILRGYLMIRVAKFIFMGPSSALSPSAQATKRRGNAALIGLTSFTPRVIAYVAVQLHFTLSFTPEWGRHRTSFDYRKFYWNIVSIIEGDEDEGKAIIEFFNSHLWGNKAGYVAGAPEVTDANEGGQGNESPSDLEILLAQRAEKRARREA